MPLILTELILQKERSSVSMFVMLVNTDQLTWLKAEPE